MLKYFMFAVNNDNIEHVMSFLIHFYPFPVIF